MLVRKMICEIALDGFNLIVNETMNVTNGSLDVSGWSEVDHGFLFSFLCFDASKIVTPTNSLPR